MATTHAELVTPERVLFSGEATFVVLRSEGGEIMFLPNHTDFVGAVDICVVRIAPALGEGAEGSGPEVRAAMAGGFVHVADNRVTVLGSLAELAEEIDVPRARRALEEAEAAQGEATGAPAPAPVAAVPVAAAPVAGAAALGPAEGPPLGERMTGSTMTALLQPELPEVRARRARARLEAAGALQPSVPAAGAPPH